MPKLLDMRHDQCRYPVTQESPWVFCGREKTEHSSYCARHHKLCVKKKVRAIEFLAEWVNHTDTMSKAVRPQPEEQTQPVDEALTWE